MLVQASLIAECGHQYISAMLTTLLPLAENNIPVSVIVSACFPNFTVA